MMFYGPNLKAFGYDGFGGSLESADPEAEGSNPFIPAIYKQSGHKRLGQFFLCRLVAAFLCLSNRR